MSGLLQMLDGQLILGRRLAIAAAARARGMSIEELREAERMIDEIGWVMEEVLESVSLAMEGRVGADGDGSTGPPESALVASLPQFVREPAMPAEGARS